VIRRLQRFEMLVILGVEAGDVFVEVDTHLILPPRRQDRIKREQHA
jgi:hypothetical protein